MRSILARLSVLLGAFSLPVLAFAKIPYFGAIVPDAINRCPAGFAALIVVVNNLVSFFITFAIIFVAPLMLGYAGFLLVVNPFNPSAKATARTLLSNVVIGVVVALGGYLIVDSLLAVLYNPATVGANWYELVSGDGSQLCLKQAGSLENLNQGAGSNVTLQVTGVGSDGAKTISTGDYSTVYDPGVEKQLPGASVALANLIGCIKTQPGIPASMGRISSISDSQIASGAKTFKECSLGGCAHAAHSCHYGGRTCVGQSYAVDFGDGDPGTDAAAKLTAAAHTCGADFVNQESNHLHVSVGKSCGCDSTD